MVAAISPSSSERAQRARKALGKQGRRARETECTKREAGSYHNEGRTHLSLGKDAPIGRPIDRFGRIIAEPMVGGLHYRYARI